MDKNNSEKDEKSKNTLEITISANGVISGGKHDSNSENNAMCNMNDNANDETSKKGQISNQSDSSDSTNDETSKKHHNSNESNSHNSCNDDSRKDQIIINITH